VAEVIRRKKMKARRFFFSTGLFLLFFGLISPGEAVVDRIVAVVNQEIITLSEVQKRSHLLQEEILTEDRLERRQRVQEVFRKVLERLIDEKLIDQEAKKSGIKVPSREIEGAIEEMKRRNALDQENFEKLLAAEGLTVESLKKEIEKQLLRTKVINWAVKVEPKAGEKELRDFYQDHIDRYRINESYRISHIFFLIPKDASLEQSREIRKKSLKVLERIRGGEDFGEMALLYSEDPSSRKDRGDMGYFKKGELLPALEREAVHLRVGEVSGLIRTDVGYHIIKLLDRKGGESLPFEEVKEKVRADHYNREMEKAFQQFLSKLKEKSVIQIKL
jgi:peptidyl-prolyl cis-trans isomerase SurA